MYINRKTSFFNEKMSFKRIQEFQVICRKCCFLLQFGFDYKDKIKYVKDDKRQDKKIDFPWEWFLNIPKFPKNQSKFWNSKEEVQSFFKISNKNKFFTRNELNDTSSQQPLTRFLTLWVFYHLSMVSARWKPCALFAIQF